MKCRCNYCQAKDAPKWEQFSPIEGNPNSGGAVVVIFILVLIFLAMIFP